MNYKKYKNAKVNCMRNVIRTAVDAGKEVIRHGVAELVIFVNSDEYLKFDSALKTAKKLGIKPTPSYGSHIKKQNRKREMKHE